MPGTELFGIEEHKEVQDVMQTGILFRYTHDQQRNGIWKAREFEAEARKITGAKFAHAVSNGSAGIAIALAASGIGAGDEVIVPPFTYIATVEAVLFLGAVPVFAEIDETLCLSADGIKKALTPNTRAVCLVHMCGGMADMDAINAVVAENNLSVVEDAGQAFAASYKGTATGLFGKAGSYSFDFFKIATAGEGGIGGIHMNYTYTSCITLTCTTQAYATANHFALHVSAGVRFYATKHVFIRPQFDYRYVPNFTQYGSNSVPEYGAAVGYSFTEH